MIAIDTNVLVRILVDDPGAYDQMQAARTIAAEARGLYLPQIVQVELVWVLESAYGFDKTAICRTLEHLLEHPLFHPQSADLFAMALDMFRTHSADFSDCLILAESMNQKLRLLTFDKKLARLKGTQRVL